MQDNNLFNGLFQGKNAQQGKNPPSKLTRYQRLYITFTLFVVVFYPFAIVGMIPLLVVQFIDKKDKEKHIFDREYESFLKRGSSLFILCAVVLTVINLLTFLFWIPSGYFSTYLFFPFNLLKTSLQFNWQTLVALGIGGAQMGSVFIAFSSFISKRKIVSKEDEQKKIEQSKAYKDRKKNKFEVSQQFTDEDERLYEKAVLTSDFMLYQQLQNILLLGTSEYGQPYKINISELNQHALIPATTGSGKTTLLQLIIQHASKYNMPLILVDGKGAKDTLNSMESISRYYGKEIRAFTDTGDMRYNPVKDGNDISVRDKLVSLAETESVFYSSAAKGLLQVTIQLLDEFTGIEGVERSLPYVQKYLTPRHVLHLFSSIMIQHNPRLFTIEVEVKPKPKKKKESKKQSKKLDDIGESEEQEFSKEAPSDKKFDDIKQDEEPLIETEPVVLNPETLELESYYRLLKGNLWSLRKEEGEVDEAKKELFDRLFVRYEHKSSPFYLYATSESLQNNLNMLLDSDLGKLFDTKGSSNVLDVQQIARRNELVYVSLNGLIYKEFIRTLAQMLVGDINFFASEMYRTDQKKGIFVIFDEPASYLNESFIDMVNKGRGAGVHAIYSPQTMADIAKLGDKLMEQLVGNVNTLIIGKTNEKGEAEYWSQTLGTYQDIEVTSMVEQEDGFSDVGKADWIGERGTQRNVDRFKISPNRFKELRTGEFIIHRSAENVHVPPQLIYVRNALKWLKENKKLEQ